MIRSPMFINYVCYNNKLRPVKNTCAVDSGDCAVIHADLLCIRLNTVEDLDSLCIELNCCLRVHSHCKIQTISKPKWTPTAKTQHNIERRLQKLWISEGRPREMEHFQKLQTFGTNLTPKDIDDIDDEAPACDIRLFWKLKWQLKPCSSRIYPDIEHKGKLFEDSPGVVSLMRLQSTFGISTTLGKTQAMIQTSSRL